MRSVESTSFEYQVADCWDEAVELLTLWQGEGKILAGGQSLVPMLNLRLMAPVALIDINPIGRQEPYVEGAELVIPALARHTDVLASPVVRQHCPLLSHAIGLVGNVRVRNRGTFGGSIAHADPTGEIPCAVLVTGGRIIVQGPRGRRSIEAQDFFLTYLTTAAEPDEVVTEVRIPVRRPGVGWGFEEKMGRYSDFATVEAAAQVACNPRTREIESVSVVLGGVADRPLALPQNLVHSLMGQAGDVDEIRGVAEAAAESVEPESDVHASADHRKHLTRVLTQRALTEAVSSAQSEGASS